ncbi:hypothetical protein JCM3765_007552 [Sporobolomyces pararoseus]
MPRGRNSSSPVAKAARVMHQNKKKFSAPPTPDIILSSDSSGDEEPPSKRSRSSSSGTSKSSQVNKKRKVPVIVIDSDLDSDDAESQPSRNQATSSRSNGRRAKRADSLDIDALDLAEAQDEQQQKKGFKKSGETVEGRNDQIVLLLNKKFRTEQQHARPVKDRQDFARKLKKVFTQPPAFPSPSIKSAAAIALTEKIKSIRRGKPLPLPARASQEGVAVSGSGTQVLAATLNSIEDPDLRSAVEDFFVKTPDRIQWAGENINQIEGGLAKATEIAIGEIKSILKSQTSLSSAERKSLLDRIISPGGPLFSPVGHFSNFPPETALNNNHRSGVNPYTWTGNLLTKKHSDISKTYFQDALLFVSSTSDTSASIGSEIRTRPQPRIDGADGSGVAARHAVDRVAVDMALLAVSERLVNETVTVFTGAQARSMMENVTLAVEEDGDYRTYKRRVALDQLYGVKNNHGEYADGSSFFDMNIVYSKHAGKFSVKSINFGVSQWCAGVASSSTCNSPTMYRCAQTTDAIENFVQMLRTGYDDSSDAASNLAQAATPRKQGKNRDPSAMLKKRQSLRHFEIENDVVIPPSEIPDGIWIMALGKNDYSSIPKSLYYDATNRITHLQYQCSQSSQRASANLRSQVHDYNGRKVDGFTLRQLKLYDKTVTYKGQEMNGMAASHARQNDTLNKQVFFDENNNKINGNQKKARKAVETSAKEVYYDSDGNEMDGNAWKKYARDATLRKTSAGEVHSLEVNALQKISYDTNRKNGRVDFLLIVSLLKTHHGKFLKQDGSVDCTKFLKRMVQKGHFAIPPGRKMPKAGSLEAKVAGDFKRWAKRSMNGKNKEGWNDKWIV